MRAIRRARSIVAPLRRSPTASLKFGLLNPIVVRRVQKSRAGQTPDSYEVIAGLHRLKAFRYLQRTTIPATVLDVDDLHAELMLIDENLCRNDLSPAERAVAQARRKAIYQQIHPETKAGASGKYRPKSQFGQVGQAENHPAPRYDEAAAEATGQSERAVRRDVTRGEALGEDVLAKVARTSLDKGEELDALAKLSPDHRNVLIARAASGEKVSAKVEVKKEHRAARERELGARQIAAPDGKFGVIVEDYEWDHVTWSEQGRDRAAENHYPVSRDAHTAQEIVRRTKDRFACAADDCVCFQWTTLQHLAIAIDVLRLRGFEYKSSYAWGKDKIGLGYWSREKHEILLIGVKGNIACPALGTQWESLVMAPRAEHSAKPECFLEMIEQYFPTLPKIELNRRGPPREGWKAWGNEALPTPDATEIPAPSVARDIKQITAAYDGFDLPNFLRIGHPECWRKEM